MIGKIKKGNLVEFHFAGCIEKGVVIEVDKTMCVIDDGSYRYPVKLEAITKKVRKLSKKK